MIGSAGKKIQTMVDLAEELYERMNDLREKLQATNETVDAVDARTERIEAELAEQRAMLEAIAEERGIDVDVIADAAPDGEGEQ